MIETRVREIAGRAREVFMQYGFRSVSMDDICREQGISKKTLYRYFSNKEDLISHILKIGLDDFELRLQSVVDTRNNAIEDLMQLSFLISEHVQKGNPTVSFDLKKYYPALHRENLVRNRKFAQKYILENLEKGMKDGIYRTNLNSTLIASMYVQRIEDLHDPQYYDASAPSFDHVFEVMFDNHIRGIVNDKGIALYEKRMNLINH